MPPAWAITLAVIQSIQAAAQPLAEVTPLNGMGVAVAHIIRKYICSQDVKDLVVSLHS